MQTAPASDGKCCAACCSRPMCCCQKCTLCSVLLVLATAGESQISLLIHRGVIQLSLVLIFVRYKLGDGEVVVDMVFFDDVTKDLTRKPTDVLVNEFLVNNVIIPPNISRLVGRNYVVEVVVSNFSFHRENIDYHVLESYTKRGLGRRVHIREWPNRTATLWS